MVQANETSSKTFWRDDSVVENVPREEEGVSCRWREEG